MLSKAKPPFFEHALALGIVLLVLLGFIVLWTARIARITTPGKPLQELLQPKLRPPRSLP